MSTSQLTSKEYFRMLNILFYALIAGQVIFALVIVYLKLTGVSLNNFPEYKQTLLYAFPFIVLAGIYASQAVYKSKLVPIKAKTDLREKMSDFRTACIIRWALLEVPGSLSLIICFLTGDLLFIAVAAIVIGYFLMIRPSIEKTIIDLELDFEDQTKINNPDEIIAEITTAQ